MKIEWEERDVGRGLVVLSLSAGEVWMVVSKEDGQKTLVCLSSVSSSNVGVIGKKSLTSGDILKFLRAYSCVPIRIEPSLPTRFNGVEVNF